MTTIINNTNNNNNTKTTTTTNNNNNHSKNVGKPTVRGSTASALQYLLQEDPLLSELHLTSLSTNTNNSNDGSDDPASFAYAAALINADNSWLSPSLILDPTTNKHNTTNTPGGGGVGDIKRKAEEALIEVDQKLALVESLAERISREKPEHVAGPLLKLHGYSATTSSSGDEDSKFDDSNEGSTTTLLATRERCLRLSRQSEVLDSVSRRVETTLVRGLTRMEAATTKLERVLHTGKVLKMIMRLRFEARKVVGSGLDFGVLGGTADSDLITTTGADLMTTNTTMGDPDPTSSTRGNYTVDLRDLTRAAASIATMEHLLTSPELQTSSHQQPLHIITTMRPHAQSVAQSVRRAAAGLLEEQHHSHQTNSTNTNSASQLGATLQVYYHLGELADAAWNAVGLGLDKAEKASGVFLNGMAVERLVACAKAEARAKMEEDKDNLENELSTMDDADGATTNNNRRVRSRESLEQEYQRTLKKNLRDARAEAASKWASGISEAALQVWNLHRVLARKSDPVSRQNFLEVVNRSPVPEKFARGLELVLAASGDTGGGGGGVELQKKKTSIFAIFWNQMCASLGARIQKLLLSENGKIADDVVNYYPAARAAALDMLNSIQDTMQAGTAFMEEVTAAGGGLVGSGGGGGGGGVGILGGSAGLDDTVFFGWSSNPDSTANNGRTTTNSATTKEDHVKKTLNSLITRSSGNDDLEATTFGAISADSWTKTTSSTHDTAGGGNGTNSSSLEHRRNGGGGFTKTSAVSQTSSALSTILSSPEWLALQGSSIDTNNNHHAAPTGLYPMQQKFLQALDERLLAPLNTLFLQNTLVDENGISLAILPTLPSLTKDMPLLESIVREELSLADPREGGGESSMATMISERIVDMVERFCALAEGAGSGVVEEGMFRDLGVGGSGGGGKPCEGLLHDMKVAEVMAALAASLRALPESTFVIPYRPAHSLQHEEAANMCQIALLPALHEIESLAKAQLLNPLCRVLNTRISSVIAKMHRGIYLESNATMAGDGSGGVSFVRDHLVDVYDSISTNVLSRLPTEYANIITSTIAAFSIYCFVSNATLVRPLGESGRLRITQDLADFELTLEQLINKVVVGTNGNGSSSSTATTTTLAQLAGGKPYAELRAVRQMLFWTGLENQDLSPKQASKAFLREVWVKDIRASTAFHFLFSFAPRLLSSPHHSTRMGAEEYCKVLVKLDGAIEDGEGRSWITTMACCEAYQQRESVDGGGGGVGGGDRRIASILMIVGPELLRRKRH